MTMLPLLPDWVERWQRTSPALFGLRRGFYNPKPKRAAIDNAPSRAQAATLIF